MATGSDSDFGRLRTQGTARGSPWGLFSMNSRDGSACQPPPGLRNRRWTGSIARFGAARRTAATRGSPRSEPSTNRILFLPPHPKNRRPVMGNIRLRHHGKGHVIRENPDRMKPRIERVCRELYNPPLLAKLGRLTFVRLFLPSGFRPDSQFAKTFWLAGVAIRKAEKRFQDGRRNIRHSRYL